MAKFLADVVSTGQRLPAFASARSVLKEIDLSASCRVSTRAYKRDNLFSTVARILDGNHAWRTGTRVARKRAGVATVPSA
jgi:hypothetical protein